ncbi:MAG: carbohydrate ABC transporter permease [Anaerolineae bacterium]
MVGVLVVQLVTITMAGYAFARLKFVGRGILLFLILLQIMIPTAVLLVQNFATIRELGLFDTRWALMLPYWGSAFGVLLMRQAFREVPFELEEAARIDGANWLQIMRHVYVPLTIPTYVAFALVSVSSHWNEFLWPFIVTRTEEVRPLTVGLNKLYQTTDVGALYGQLMAGTLIVVAPLVILFILFQRRFIESFASSGIK